MIRLSIRIYRGIARRFRRFLVLNQVKSAGKNFVCDNQVSVYGGEHITIGNNVTLNKGVILQSCEGAKIEIGDNVTISYNALVITGNLNYDPSSATTERGHKSYPITIGNNVWIGANACILPGVTVCNNVVIAAGAVVTKSITEEFAIYGGTPAKKLKAI